jgi:hypothetical protein
MPDTPARPEFPDSFAIDACECAFVEKFLPYKGNPDPLVVWRAAWEACRAQARAEWEADLKPVAWMRVHTTPGTPYAPAEHDIEAHIGEDMPDDGRPWTPLAVISSTKEGHEDQ